MKRFTNHLEPWGEFVDVKHWPPIRNPQRYAGRELFLGSVTDPYQPLEARYGRTRALLLQMQGSGCTVSIATKSDLVLRDLDLIKTFPNARVCWSINTLDEDFRRDMDNAVAIERRLAAMKAFHDAGVRTTCFISPIFPGITDVQAIIRRARDRCNLVWLENLNLRGSYKKAILEYISQKRPELTPLYEAIYQRRDRGYWMALDEECAPSPRRRACLTFATTTPSAGRSRRRPCWSTTFFTRRSFPRPGGRRREAPPDKKPRVRFNSRARGVFWGSGAHRPLRSMRVTTHSSFALWPKASWPCSMKRSTTSRSALSA